MQTTTWKIKRQLESRSFKLKIEEKMSPKWYCRFQISHSAKNKYRQPPPKQDYPEKAQGPIAEL